MIYRIAVSLNYKVLGGKLKTETKKGTILTHSCRCKQV